VGARPESVAFFFSAFPLVFLCAVFVSRRGSSRDEASSGQPNRLVELSYPAILVLSICTAFLAA